MAACLWCSQCTCVHKAWAHLLQLLLQAGLPLQQCEALLLSKVKQLRQLTCLKEAGHKGTRARHGHEAQRCQEEGSVRGPMLGLAV